MKGKSWSSNVGGWMVISIWNCQCCKMLIGPPAGNELNRVGSGYFRWVQVAAWKQPMWVVSGSTWGSHQGSAIQGQPECPQVSMRVNALFGLMEPYVNQQCWSSESWTTIRLNHITPISPQAKRCLVAESWAQCGAGNPAITSVD